MLHERRGYFSEHRYDALGRRVLVRTRRDGLCRKGTSTIADCTGGITRYVWAGDNLLWEMRGPGADSVPGARLNDISAPAQEFGVVGYTHAGGIDRPLVVWKGIGATPTEVVVPHANWRGVYGKGTTSSGATSTVPIEWPGFKTTAYHSMGPSQQSTTNWMGSLIGGQRDPGGTMYMRNRYYDPQTGQFTQTDPIGIGGGLNTYGFAAGDPVGNWDPFGTCAWGIGPDAAFGRCSGMEPQDRHACTRDATGWCETYTATPEQWSRIEREILRISRRTAYCAGARSLLLSLWNRGRTARGIRFWDGYFGIYEGEIMVGQYMGYTGFDHVEYDPREAFRDPQVVPHEGLHLYYRRNPPPGMDYVKDYQAIHRIIHQQDGECAR